jgi:O-antigen/teichoic acid export membrane protein
MRAERPDRAKSPRQLLALGRRLPDTVRSPAGRRTRWGIADQAVSSLTNFAVAAVAARAVAPRAFGAFSVALAAYVFVMWLGRALVSEPLVVRFTTADADARRRAGAEALGAAIVVGALTGVVMLAAGALLAGTLGAVVAAMAVCLPALLAQDAYRYLLMAEGRTWSAAWNDTIWFGTQTVLVATLLATGHATAVTLVLAFGVGAAAAAVGGARQAHVIPALGRSHGWLRDHRDLGVPFAIELVAVNGVGQVALVLVAVVAGVVAVGELRAAILLLSPPTVLFSGLFLCAIPEAVRLRERSLRALRTLVIALAVGTVAVTVAWGVAISLVPTHLGQALLRSNWANGRHLLVPAVVLTAGSAAALASVVGLRGLASARDSLRVRILAAPITLVAAVVGGRLDGAYGAGVGLAAAACVSAALAWVAFSQATRRAGVAPEAAAAATDVAATADAADARLVPASPSPGP